MAEEKEFWCTVRDEPCECDKSGCVTKRWFKGTPAQEHHEFCKEQDRKRNEDTSTD